MVKCSLFEETKCFFKVPRCADQTHLDISASKSLVFNYMPETLL